jgi:hypothetical protein
VTEEQDIVKALRNYLEAQGAPISRMDIQVQAITDDYTRVEVLSTDPDVPGGFNAFLKRESGVWTTVVSGPGMEKVHVEALGIPEGVWPEGWRSQDS